MVILLNTDCSGGKGLEKWNSIKNYMLNTETIILQSTDADLADKIKRYIANGETKFAAAGGDGTVNYLLNKLIELTDSDQRSKIILGAIGIGSSNDFHKPFHSKTEGIPVCMDFVNSYPRDVGVITYASDKGEKRKYFLINSSIGITAEANNLFNEPDFLLQKLKKFNTKSAILYAAVKTMVTYKNLHSEIIVNGGSVKTSITNLGITKNPQFSGDFCYDTKASYSSGKFDVHLAHDMNKFEILKLINALTSNRFSKLIKTLSWHIDSLRVTSQNNFAVEFDGEVILTNKVEFRILNNFIKVCDHGKSI